MDGDGAEPHRAVFFRDGDESAPPKRTLDPLVRVDDPAVGEWLVKSMTTFAKSVASFLPGHFEAYARVFTRVERRWPRQAEPVTWREVATAAGVAFDECTKVHTLIEAAEEEFVSRGDLHPALIGPLIEHLSPATSTPDDCVFALWEGYAGTVPFETAQPTLLLPARSHHVFRGPIECARISFQQYFGDQAANLWWPADHAWCVSTPIYSYSTFVGGSRACIDALLADPRLESKETYATRECWS